MSLEGILNIDKPQGITSHDAVNQVRRISGIRRVGHAGTLDPLATGVILLCLGRATRLAEYLIGQPKRYLATVRLGQETDTYDADGEIVAEMTVQASQADIKRALSHFYGHIQQKAPSYSAIKQAGQPLYKLARKGEAVEPPIREIHISELELLSWVEPFLQIAIACSSGTYIRSLAHDLGHELGCGGHITELRRTAVGGFSLDHSVTLDELHNGKWSRHVLPSDTAVQHFPHMILSQDQVQRVQFGQRLERQEDHPDAPLVRIYEPKGQFLGIVSIRGNSWQPHKVFLPES